MAPRSWQFLKTVVWYVSYEKFRDWQVALVGFFGESIHESHQSYECQPVSKLINMIVADSRNPWWLKLEVLIKGVEGGAGDPGGSVCLAS